MGGLGSGRKSKTTDLEPEETILEGGDASPKSESKVKPKGKTPSKKFSVLEIREKIDLLFSGIAAVFGREYVYSENDFDSEAAGIVRLAEKYNMVFYALSLIDPVLVALGLFKKFNRLKSKPRAEKQKQPSENPPNVVNMARH